MIFNVPRARRVPFTTSGAESLGQDDRGWQWTECLSRQKVLSVNENATNFSVDLPRTGWGVDLVVLDSTVAADHPDFGDRLKKINWFAEAGGEWAQYSATEDWDAYYARPNDGHATPTASAAAGTLYGFAKNADIYTIKHDFASWSSMGGARDKRAMVLRLIADWHTRKPSKKPTVITFGSIIGSNLFLSDTRSYHGINGTHSRAELLNMTLQERQDITREHRVGAMTSNLVGLEYDEPIKLATDYASAAGVHLCYPADNKVFVLDRRDQPKFGDYWFREWSTGFFNNITAGSVGVSEDAVVIGGVGGETDHSVSGSSQMQEFLATWGSVDGSSRGGRVDIFAPGTHCPAARDAISTTTPTGLGMYKYPGSNDRWVRGFSGTSLATPLVAGVLCCILEDQPGLSPADAKAALIGAASKGRLFEYDNPKPSKRLSLMGARNNYLYYPF